uniref:Chloroplast processing enzyme n=1 Tax=Solanum tuberosum TaxID=4113 RepID=M1DF64_SOLTU
MEPSPEPSEHKEEEDEEWEVESYDEPDEFELLEPIEKLDYEQELSSAPFQVEHHGVLQNGLTYYVKKNSTPKDIILVNLIVKAGAVCEEENERGVAHIIEHLVLEGYGYTNSDATEYLKAFKHQCGAHQQAKTYWDHTSYNFSVTNSEDLRKALALTAAISQELVVTSDELEKEKLIVIDELWHGSQIVEKQHSRIFSAQLYQGTKYAEPLGGTEKNVRDLSVDIVKGFYLKWYVPNNMAVIVVGDATETQVYVSFMFEKQWGKRVNEVFIYFQQILLQKVIVERLKKILLSMSNPKEIQYSRDNDSQMYSNFVVWVECEGYETIKVLETFLVEIARLRVHGIEENELSEGCVFWLKTAGAEYRNRLDHSSEELQKNYTRHFNYRECDLCPKLQAQLIVALTKSVNVEKMKSFCELQCKASNLSVIILQSKNFVTQEDMKGSLQKITDLEKEGSLAQRSDEEVKGSNNLILEMEPESGKIVERVEHSDIGAVELILSNGMQVTYQCTMDDEGVLLSGFSYGGLSELAKEDLLSCLFSCEIGQNVLCKSFERFFTACDKVGFKVAVDEYKRAFSANFVDSSYIKLALQIVYFLFTSDLEPEEEDLQAVVDDLRERLSPRHQRLQDILVNTAKEINSGGSCIYKVYYIEVCSFNSNHEWSSSDSMSPGMLYFLIHIGNMNETEKVVDTVVQAMTKLQVDGPLEEEIQTALDSVPTKEEEETLRELKANTSTRFNADIIKSSLKRFLPWPCSSQYSVLYLTC